jgi:hypothetical protein
MAITNAQQYQQLVNKPAGNKRPGYAGADLGANKGYQGGGRDKKGSVKGAAPGAATVGPVERGGGDKSKKPPSVISSPPKKPKVTTKTKDKNTRTRKISNFLKSIYDSRKKGIYNIVPNDPELEFRFIDQLSEEDYDDLPESLKEKFEKTQTAPAIKSGKTYKDFDKLSYEDYSVLANNPDFKQYAFDRGLPGLSVAGDMSQVGNRFVKKDPITGETLRDQYGQTLYGYDPVREGGGRDNFILPVSQPVASIPEPTGYVNPLSLLTPRIAGTRFLGTEFEDEEDTESAANGGRIGAMGGGIMNTDVMGGLADGGMDESGRQMYFLGKLVKKAKRAVKKITKSPFGKAALLYGLGAMGGSYGSTGKFFSKGMFSPGNIGRGLFGNALQPNNPAYAEGILSKLGLTKGGGSLMPTFKGGITLATALPFLLGGEDDDDDKFDIDAYYAANRLNSNAPLNRRILGTEFYAAEGGMPSKEPVAKKTMPLLDMDGQEMDLRAEGGFVPIGRMERADDVPARLSKNEFVFTADAVRNAGEGDIDKGAEVMYNMMKNLESGGEVSEESQGLDGAREMFQTSKRLEEVL